VPLIHVNSQKKQSTAYLVYLFYFKSKFSKVLQKKWIEHYKENQKQLTKNNNKQKIKDWTETKNLKFIKFSELLNNLESHSFEIKNDEKMAIQIFSKNSGNFWLRIRTCKLILILKNNFN